MSDGAPIAYLDHAATAPLRPEVVDAMAPFLHERFGNASGSHRLARDARRALEESRDIVAAHLGASPDEVVFTSGGTEADNLAVWGTLGARSTPGAPDGPHGTGAATVPPLTLVCSAVEHAAVLEPCRAAARTPQRFGGAAPDVVHEEALVHPDGTLDLDALGELLGAHHDVVLVSVMLANNEVGTVQPLDAVVDLVHARAPRAVVHTDAVQAAPWLDLAHAPAVRADLVSISAHKLGGPKGAGALVVRRRARVTPMLRGGGQEADRRSGTVDVAGAVGLAAALEACAAHRATDGARVRALRDRLADGLLAAVPGTLESSPRTAVLPGHCHLRFAGCESEELLVLLDDHGVCAAAGSACASGALEPSHVLLAMGVPAPEARTGIRFTLGHTTTDADVERALAVVPVAVARLRG